MIITITDHYGDAIERLAATDDQVACLRDRVLSDECPQPAAMIVVDIHTMTEILSDLASRGLLSITKGAC